MSYGETSSRYKTSVESMRDLSLGSFPSEDEDDLEDYREEDNVHSPNIKGDQIPEISQYEDIKDKVISMAKTQNGSRLLFFSGARVA